ncbi:MAG: hypothetical protein A2015_03350 [Spirochaetes bacterium GWF1_31_7]|nr:MAG: hypothetical protein A2Y30_07435 [Spirochaetes bacterium GWE1_32_154]OHD48417.1 MAG: hypothetical protein A2Y29_05310 [Spirochaetes bacterium GWE2_31_10]OHD50893.1 MAG: hypothetical protein A2015_03350 [Spirochaetes bacterium GWF1_31_7]OHD79585.1 MAG: hypothetical protein A2355_03915 [Spirochaetes bacterium RIFOXYB1_FULL_32_8]
MITIVDIAKEASVGVGTVSRAINGGKNVSSETMVKIEAAIRKLHYIPNKSARNLPKKNYARTTIGVVVPVIIHPFYMEIIKGIYQFLQTVGFNLLIFNVGRDEEDLFKHIAGESLSGIIVIAKQISQIEKKILSLSNTRFVYVDHHEDDVTSFYTDNTKGGYIAAEYLISKGITAIGYIGENSGSIQQKERVCGVRKALEKHHISLVFEEYIPFSEDESYMLTKQYIESGSVNGVLYFCDSFAYGGLRAKKELASDVELVGYDDLDVSKYVNLTTIHQPASETGKKAAEYLIRNSTSGQWSNETEKIEPVLIIRNGEALAKIKTEI